MMLNELLELTETRITAVLESCLSQKSLAPALQAALEYTLLAEGKRLRPLLVYATGTALGVSLDSLDAAAGAVEILHTYSLIHDDLPCMDNADLRRGRPACHKAFGEAVAVLAGDALQPLAFELIATHPAPLSAEQRIQMIATLSRAAGMQGMVAGQVLDMEGVTSSDTLETLYRLKTGALLKACIQLAVMASASSPLSVTRALETFADHIGLAFQIQDDLLDFQSSQITGKTGNLDANNQKNTWPALTGLSAAQKKIESLFADAMTAIAPLNERSQILQETADYILRRLK